VTTFILDGIGRTLNFDGIVQILSFDNRYFVSMEEQGHLVLMA
jgi:hypothetical protein